MSLTGPDVVVIMTDQERAAPPYEPEELGAWRRLALPGRRWFDEHAVSFDRHYTGSLACVPSRPTLFTGHYPDVHGVTQTDGLGKDPDDSRLRWLRPGEVPTLGHWFRAGGYDTHYDGKWHISHADLRDPETGETIHANDDDGRVLPDGVERYREADALDPFGFSGWIGPEPHGAKPSNTGLRRDGLLADRIVAWLEHRHARRAAGDPEAARPFLLVASFLNPHDIALFPLWLNRGRMPAPDPERDPPPVPAPPTAGEPLEASGKPAAQAAFRDAYPSGYGPPDLIGAGYRDHAEAYRLLYYRLHAEVDGPIDRVRRAVTASVSPTLIVRTSDHGELLGAHGGLHQKWFNLYDEATRVPFQVVWHGRGPSESRRVAEPSSHVDLVPTLLDAAGIDEETTAAALAQSLTEVHPLPGRSLLPIIDGGRPDPDRAVYAITRDCILDGDSGLSPLGRLSASPGGQQPPELWIEVPRHVGNNFEGVVARVAAEVAGGGGRLWKLVRTFDDPDTWTVPGVAQLVDSGRGVRTEPLADEWELYDLDTDPIEAVNRAGDAPAVLSHLVEVLDRERSRSCPTRNSPWSYTVHPAAAARG